MLTISQATKSFGADVLFEEISLQVNRGDRLGLIGANGSGKSTLFSLILGRDEPDQGTIQLQKNARMGFLPQENAPVGEETVLQLATLRDLRSLDRAQSETSSDPVERVGVAEIVFFGEIELGGCSRPIGSIMRWVHGSGFISKR